MGALLTQQHVFGGLEPSSSAGRRVVLVALDAADWIAIDPLIKSGALPTFARLRARGRTGLLISTPPLVSPMVWTTIATGVEPENHGILDFMQDLPDGRQVPVGSAQRLSPALWNLFSDGGRRVAIVGWWATWPAERVRGTIVSDALAPQLTRETRRADVGLVSPGPVLSQVSPSIVKASSLTREDLNAYVALTPAEFGGAMRALAQPGGRFYKDPLAHLAEVVASTRTYSRIAERLLRDERPDLLAVYIETIDTVSHLFMKDPRRGARAIEAAYRDADALMGHLAGASPPDTLVIVCSDHGFYPAGAGITEDPSNLTGPATAWHRPYGIIGVATAGTLTGMGEDRDLRGPMAVGGITPLDIAPTLLHAAGLPVSSEMPGRVVTEMLPADLATRVPRRVMPAKFSPPATPSAGRQDNGEAIARLQALGYIGSVKTSLARLNLAESFFRRGKLPQAERELRAVIAAQPDNLSAHLWLAQTLERQDRLGEALTAYSRAVALPGGAQEALIAATDLAIREHQLTRARRLVDTAGVARDRAVPVCVALGAIAEAARDHTEAERQYRAALAADPLSFDAAARLLDLLVERGRARDSLASLERAVTLAPESPRHVALLGEAHLAVGDGAPAEAAFRRALQLAPDGQQTRLSLARAMIVQQKYGPAIDGLQSVPDSPERDLLLGAAYSGARDWVRASQRLQAALEAGRTTPDVLNSLGWAQLQLGHRAEAAALLERSLKANPDQPDIRRLLTDIQAKNPGVRR